VIAERRIWGSFAACAALGLALQWLLPAAALIPALLAAILLGGMPHGGLDVFLARRRFPLRGPVALAVFFAAYLTLAALVVAVWLAAPTAALIAFLGYSALHFGGDWSPAGRFGAASAGIVVLALPALAAPDPVADLFAALGADGAVARDVLRAAGLAALVGAVAAFRARPAHLALLGALAALALVAHPLAYFLAFFCGVHGPMHILRIRRRYGLSGRAILARWVGPAMIAGLAVLILAVLMAPRVGLDTAAMRAVFVGFAALTVPHMLLVDLAAGAPRRETVAAP